MKLATGKIFAHGFQTWVALMVTTPPGLSPGEKLGKDFAQKLKFQRHPKTGRRPQARRNSAQFTPLATDGFTRSKDFAQGAEVSVINFRPRTSCAGSAMRRAISAAGRGLLKR